MLIRYISVEFIGLINVYPPALYSRGPHVWGIVLRASGVVVSGIEPIVQYARKKNKRKGNIIKLRIFRTGLSTAVNSLIAFSEEVILLILLVMDPALLKRIRRHYCIKVFNVIAEQIIIPIDPTV